jgi:hypothetical protein
LANYAAECLRQLPPGNVTGRHVFRRVKSVGSTLPGVGHNLDKACCRIGEQFQQTCMRADPPGTVRAERIQLIGPLCVSPLPSGSEDVAGFTETFGVKVISAAGTGFAQWLGDLRSKPYEMPDAFDYVNHLRADLAMALREVGRRRGSIR